MISPLRVLFRSIMMIPIVSIFAAASLCARVLIFSRRSRLIFQADLVSWACAVTLKIMNIKVTVTGNPEDRKNYFLVGNHLGFIDIFVISSIRPSLFITSMEMRQTPGLGQITDLGGCLYVNRLSRAKIQEEIEQIRSVLSDGHNVVLFPEARAYDGVQVQPFKKSLITAVAGTGIPILPMVINYRKVNGETMSDKWRDSVCWYGDQGFFGAASRAFSMSSAEVELRFLSPIFCNSEDQRKEVVGLVQAQVESLYIPIPRPQSNLHC